VNESQKPGVYRIPCECGLHWWNWSKSLSTS
jgi:hypothetical protein